MTVVWYGIKNVLDDRARPELMMNQSVSNNTPVTLRYSRLSIYHSLTCMRAVVALSRSGMYIMGRAHSSLRKEVYSPLASA